MYTTIVTDDLPARLNRSIEHVSPITNEDHTLFDQFIGENTLDFSNSWLYTKQATAFGGNKYHYNKTLIAFTVYRPHTLPWAFVQYLGKNAMRQAFVLGQKLMKDFNTPIIFKNLTEKQYSELVSYGCQDYRPGDGWNAFYRYDDDTFPETIVETDRLCSLQGRSYHSIRSRIRQFYKNNIRVEQYTPSHYSDTLLILEKWLTMIKYRYEKYLENDPIILHSASIHRNFIEYITKNQDSHCIAQLIYIDDVPISFAIGYKISNSTLGVYTTVTATDKIKGLSEATTYELVKSALQKKYKYVNLGGSEFKSLLNFKKKFNPSIAIQKRHAILYP